MALARGAKSCAGDGWAAKPDLGGVVEWRFKFKSEKAAYPSQEARRVKGRRYGESCGWDGGISNY